jgi:hypothetical protein
MHRTASNRAGLLVAAGAACLALAAPAGAQPAPTINAAKFRAELKVVERAHSDIVGTWILQKRINPDGKEHAKPLRGEAVFTLNVDRTVAVNARAAGKFRMVEEGIMDGGFSRFNPGEDVINPDPTSSRIMFHMEGSGQVEIGVNQARSSVLNITYVNQEVKGTYGVFRTPVRTQRLESQFQTASGFLFFSKRSMKLANEPRMNIAANLVGVGSLQDRSHQIRSQTIRGNRMDVLYGNGGRDIWIRTSR